MALTVFEDEGGICLQKQGRDVSSFGDSSFPDKTTGEKKQCRVLKLSPKTDKISELSSSGKEMVLK